MMRKMNNLNTLFTVNNSSYLGAFLHIRMQLNTSLDELKKVLDNNGRTSGIDWTLL